jgi:TolB protein
MAAPAWSPNGKLIVFTRSDHHFRSRLYLIRPDGTGLQRLTSVTGHNPSWSPDGTLIAFDDGRRIAVIGAGGQGLRYLTKPAGADSDPAWSPDGRAIAFVRSPSAQAGRRDIWLMSRTARNQRLLIKNGSQPAWKP